MTFFKLSLIAFFLFLITGCQTAKTGDNVNIHRFSIQDEHDIVAAMNKSADDWNQGNLDAFMSIYDSSATFMTSNGPIGVNKMRENYNNVFFVDGKPKQSLRFEEMTIKPLGTDYALLLGKFILSGNNLKELSGRYSVVFIRTGNGWKMLHDHSG